jgi:hypothetical protein
MKEEKKVYKVEVQMIRRVPRENKIKIIKNQKIPRQTKKKMLNIL